MWYRKERAAKIKRSAFGPGSGCPRSCDALSSLMTQQTISTSDDVDQLIIKEMKSITTPGSR